MKLTELKIWVPVGEEEPEPEPDFELSYRTLDQWQQDEALRAIERTHQQLQTLLRYHPAVGEEAPLDESITLVPYYEVTGDPGPNQQIDYAAS